MNHQTVKQGDTIAVWFSCGAASAVAAKRTIKRYGDIATIRVVNNPVAEEHPDNLRFLRDVEAWLGVEIEFATNSDWPSASAVDVWSKRRYMAGIAGAPCTSLLKKEARRQWEAANPVDWHVLGFTVEEQDRAERFKRNERANLIPILIEDEISKQGCFFELFNAGIKVPEMYTLGYPNANCIGCVKVTSPTYWNHVRLVNPEVFEQRAAFSREIGARLVEVHKERVFLDELDPATMGDPLKNMQFECGIFCEEKS